MAKFQNSQTSCLATGLAISDGEAYYASGAGPAGSVEAIWASLVSNNSTIMAPEWYSTSQGFRLADRKDDHKSKKLNTLLPDSTYHHFVLDLPDPNIITIIEPKAAGTDPEAEANIAYRLAAMPQVYLRFFLWIKNNIDIPVQKEWTHLIWQAAKDHPEQPIKPMLTAGDCVGGWKFNLEFRWAQFVASLVEQSVITF
jgi:hypothetical protein